jgi:hypothetical protein
LEDKLEGAISKTGQYADPGQLENKLKEVVYHLSEVHESLDLSPSTELGRTQENVVEKTLILTNKFGDLQRWMIGREVEALKLEKQLQITRQEPLIQQACDDIRHELHEREVVPGDKPLIR